jgi:ADP-ribose pyrophosphatase
MEPSTSADAVLLTTSRFRVVEISRVATDGSVRKREILRHPGAVTILPMVDDQQVCLIRNFRVTVNRPLIELPAGTLDPREEPLQAAQRELAEETGYRAGGWRHLRSFYLSPGILDERMHLYLATDLVAGAAAREPGEEIENLVVPWGEALRWIQTGEIEDAKTIAGLLFYHQLYRAGDL